ncbi:efflux RND transporter periplasmic adaptor subunit [Methylobacterium komagatae]|jgi:Cu(I)/Ag(I) efflux system membrane fusion protein|uniref:Efflux RND transporter periplasmic adaptor subunit n=1 Tax=Methylobacterium komagatae TaxID=374425 RepID=A0ABW2BMP0_9HYPH|nr:MULTISPECIES: efflux RND transporter periplasmic adaptor subunit [Methylobacterium]MBY0252324.1 efflux RND transporter periplasmic adaptor subunit [Methylobacterium organophilum]MDE3747854.1 efflux RND transporter periplasmic adaptor subunit [Methylobacterium radiotolerans]PVZ05223.1 Cu(I)/Ag(I) efflux system membrane fusion protein [Methylobacterium organophilum]
MDQRTPFQISETQGRGDGPVRVAARVTGFTLAPAALVGAMLVGLKAGEVNWPLPAWLPAPVAGLLVRDGAGPAPDAPILYYRDPDGKAAYTLAPAKAPDGRDYRPVRFNEDVGFEPKPAEPAGGDAGMAQTGAKKLLYYRNPMGLPDTSATPKKDSMGMDYIPVYAGEAEDGNTVRISPGKVQRTGVRSEPVERRVISRPVRVPGTVTLDERRVTIVATRSDAYVDHVENVTTGDQVRKGQPLVDVYSPEINAAAAQLIANPGFDGSRRRLQNLNVPAEVIAEMERTRKVPMAITWSSPRDGVILQRTAIEGMKAAAGETLFRIGDISVMWVLADVPEYDLGSVKVGQPVAVHVRSLPGRTFAGKVALIYPQVNTQTRTTRVRIELPNPDGVLLADMYADVEIGTGATKPVVAVPNDAIIDTGARQVVLIDKGEGRFEPREVKVGARGEGYTEIRDGVKAGEQVVTAANFLIDAESNLKAALQSMATPTPPAPQAQGEEKPR